MKHRTRLAADMQVSCMILEKKSMALRKHLVTRSLTTRASSGTQLSDTNRLSATQAPFCHSAHIIHGVVGPASSGPCDCATANRQRQS
ncbi:hypothetical protein SCLCIDRAFT_597885 [Scleroderma citrinum Foug A]|uniref:Uncharacterized protein n=1 Tax=Scleroderma citrinum Foug A TaxID=1036808 RepID=A0A0C2ZTL3_9AGAM|nr:hypothetical protein SCLCIDRAFT_597885 [Scleroderma citrinum Foug A]